MGSVKANVIREEAKTALVERMLKHDEFKNSNGVAVEEAHKSDDVGAAVTNTHGGGSDEEEDNGELDGASMRGAMRKRMEEKLTEHLEFARQAMNWQRPLPTSVLSSDIASDYHSLHTSSVPGLVNRRGKHGPSA